MDPYKCNLHRLSEESKVELLPKDLAEWLHLDSKGWIVEQKHNYLYAAFFVNNYEVHATLTYHGPEFDAYSKNLYEIEFWLLRSESPIDQYKVFGLKFFRECKEFFFPLCAESIFRLLELEYSLSFRNLMNSFPGLGVLTSPVEEASVTSSVEAPKPRGICVGDIVRLRSGGPKMVVELVEDRGRTRCTWFDNDNSVKYFSFEPESLMVEC